MDGLSASAVYGNIFYLIMREYNTSQVLKSEANELFYQYICVASLDKNLNGKRLIYSL